MKAEDLFDPHFGLNGQRLFVNQGVLSSVSVLHILKQKKNMTASKH